jgi:hypothetical protein
MRLRQSGLRAQPAPDPSTRLAARGGEFVQEPRDTVYVMLVKVTHMAVPSVTAPLLGLSECRLQLTRGAGTAHLRAPKRTTRSRLSPSAPP